MDLKEGGPMKVPSFLKLLLKDALVAAATELSQEKNLNPATIGIVAGEQVLADLIAKIPQKTKSSSS